MFSYTISFLRCIKDNHKIENSKFNLLRGVYFINKKTHLFEDEFFIKILSKIRDNYFLKIRVPQSLFRNCFASVIMVLFPLFSANKMAALTLGAILPSANCFCSKY